MEAFSLPNPATKSPPLLGVQLPYDQFRVPPLAGLKVCITGFTDQALRQNLPDDVNRGGGTYSADLFKDCTHLIAKAPTGPKYKWVLCMLAHVQHTAQLSWLADTETRQGTS